MNPARAVRSPSPFRASKPSGAHRPRITKYRGLGRKIRAGRRAKNISQAELARQVGVSRSLVHAWENGHADPPLTTIVVLAKFFDTSFEALTGVRL